MAEELENTQEQSTDQVEETTEQTTDTLTVETEESTTVDTTQSEEETQEQSTDSASDEEEEVVKTTKKKSKTVGYAAAYIGKGEHTQSLPGVFKRKKDAERKLRQSGVDAKNMRVQAIKG